MASGNTGGGGDVERTRRRLLIALGAGSVGALAGCGSEEEGTPTATEPPTESPTDSPTATPTDSPTATPTESPTPTATPREFGVSTTFPEEVGATTAVLEGTLEGLGGADSAEVYFEYRRAGGDDWTATEPRTLDEPGSFSREVGGLSPRSEYEFRVVAETSDGASETTVAFSFRTSRAASIGDPSEVTATGATLTAEVAVGSGAQVTFEYRRVPAGDWTATEPRTVESAGTVSREVSGLSSRRLYEARAVVTIGDMESTTGTVPFATPSRGSATDDTEYATASRFHPGDGFASFAPWMDDDTPVITITEPTREQLADALAVDHERLIVFETSGTIDLEGGVAVENGKFYLAGQTAPSPGITLVKGTAPFVDAEGGVIQHVRARRGDDTSDAGDTIGTSETPEDIVFDHVTATWGTDETLSCYGTDMTISNSIVGEALRNSAFHEGGNGHSAGSLIGSGYTDIAMMGNVWASNLTRNPRLQSGTSVVVNNVSYDYRHAIGCSSETTSSIVGNAFIRGNVEEPVVHEMDPHEERIYVADNYARPDYQLVADGINQADSKVNWPDGLKAFPAEEVLAHNVAHAGARPADRTYHDRRLLRNLVNWETAGDAMPGPSGLDHAWLDHEEIMGGYPELPVNTHSLDVPDDGTRAWLGEWAMEVETPARGPGAYRDAGGAGPIDGFEDGDLAEYVDPLVDARDLVVEPIGDHYAVTGAAPVAEGSASLKNTSGEVALISSHADLPRYPMAGDTIAAKVATTGTTPVMGIAFGIKSHENFYFVRYTEEAGTLQFHKVSEGEWSDPDYKMLAESGSASVETGTIHELVVDWGVDGGIDVRLLGPDGAETASVSVNDSTHRYGGVGTRRTGMLDDLRIR